MTNHEEANTQILRESTAELAQALREVERRLGPDRRLEDRDRRWTYQEIIDREA